MNFNAQPAQSKNLTRVKSPKGFSIAKFFFLFFLMFVVGGIAALLFIKTAYTNAIDTPNSTDNTLVEFTILPGQTTDQTFKMLVEKGLIQEDYKYYFKYYLRETGLGATIQAGLFRATKDLTMKELVTLLQKAGIEDLWVTVPEGLRIDEIATILQKAFDKYPEAVFSAEEFIALANDPVFMASYPFEYGATNTLEGYVFSDRYLLSIESTPELVLDTMLRTFISKIGDDLTYEQLIIASMVEREAKTEYDRKMVADIILRRYEEDWVLGIDATLLYYYKDWKYELASVELNFNQPYNTRLNPGLPPTPICNPSFSSINAVLNPEPNDYYYYITGNDGNFYYARTLAEHNSNIAKYLR